MKINIPQVKVWDIFVRFFHWLLVGAVLTAYFSEGEPRWLHTTAGYTVVTLVLLRIVWGFVGPRYARFADFVYPPRTVFAYLATFVRRTPPRYLGHDPAGGAMVVVLLLMLLATTTLGLMLYAVHDGGGPFSLFMQKGPEAFAHTLEEIHEVLANTTIVLAAIHVTAVIIGSLRHRENLIKSMITGYKRPGN